MTDELLRSYEIIDGYLEDFIFLARHRIPIEQWPEEYQAIAGINPELLGPSKEIK